MVLLVAALTAILADRTLKGLVGRRPLGWQLVLAFGMRLRHSTHAVRPDAYAARRLGELVVLASAVLLLAFPTSLPLHALVGLAAGGAASNAVDARHPPGVVNCFVFRGYHAFNLADVAITGGTTLALLFALLQATA